MKKGTMIILALVAVLASGCAKDKSEGGSGGSVPNNPGYWIPPSPGPGSNPGANWQYGATANLTVTSSSLSFFTGWTVNSPKNVKVNINLQKFEPYTAGARYSYGGVVTIAFEDRGQRFEDQFSSLINEGHWYGEGMVDTNEQNNRYNVWINKDGVTAWHGFFQDSYGSVIVVIDQSDDLGDGQGPSKVSGSIWVMNFGRTYAPISPTSCWFVSVGPYDCRTWKSGDGVNTDKDIYPYLENSTSNDPSKPKPVGYRKLGDFVDLDFKKAFNGGQFGN